ncbi:hypothetical protein CRUP_032992 [Coryphaenoides rupestris]|nr:hypothetical protein CRUP_032992 [Coryphaenoides rupestris]
MSEQDRSSECRGTRFLREGGREGREKKMDRFLRNASYGRGGPSRVNPASVGIAVGLSLLALLFTIGIVQFLCKYKCKGLKKCCKKKKPSLTEKVLTKTGKKKTSTFSISGNLK